MKQTALSVFDVLLIVLAVFGVFWILEQIVKSLTFEPQPAPVIHVAINVSQPEPKQLTAGDHVKGIAKIGWDKLVENCIPPFFPSWK